MSLRAVPESPSFLPPTQTKPLPLSSRSLLHLDPFSLFPLHLSCDPQINLSKYHFLQDMPLLRNLKWLPISPESNPISSLGVPRFCLSGLALLTQPCFPFLLTLHLLLSLPRILSVNASTSLSFCPWFSSHPPSLLQGLPSVPLLCSSANFLSYSTVMFSK